MGDPASLVIAVSGGGDSIALLHRLKARAHLAVTVDHGLRAEAAEEAEKVAEWCGSLGISHRTIRLKNAPANAQAARLARYEALAAAAREAGVGKIALGHTLDDQAETVLMRALRAGPESGVIGLSGMAETTAYDELVLWRPLLGERRDALRGELREHGASWIDDPTNEDVTTERVRTRRALSAGVADPVAIARLATLAQRDRAWLAGRTAHLITQHARRHGETLFFTPERTPPRRLLREVFSILVMACGGMDHRPKAAMLEQAVSAMQRGDRFALTLGRTLIETRDDGARFSRDPRHRDRPPPGPIAPFARFRPSFDDPIHAAMVALVS